MLHIDAGPYEFIRKTPSYDKVTLCMMSDQSVSERHYDLKNNITSQKSFPSVDLDHALKTIEHFIETYKKGTYLQPGEAPVSNKSTTNSTSSSMLGKRSGKQAKIENQEEKKVAPAASTGGVRRKAKEVEKVEKTVKRSVRLQGKEKVEYNIDVLEKMLSEQDTSTNCIEVMLAHNFDPEQHDPKGWLMSEKLDGVRCYWSGKAMYTRNGNPFFAPDWWQKKLPEIALDGELWTNRDDFQKIVSIVKKHDTENQEWKKIKFMIFDAPLVKGTFKQRLSKLEKELAKNPNEVTKLVKQTPCADKDQLVKLMDDICGGKGEGVMLKNPDSMYDHRRSNDLLKVKRFQDSEAKVIGHNKGSGRCENMLGALVVKEKDGTLFKIGSGFDDSQRRKPPKLGSTVTFKFQGRTKNGIPRFPIFQRIHPGM